ETGDFIGKGKYKEVLQIKTDPDLVVAIQHKELGKTFESIDMELKALQEIKDLGLPVVEIKGKTTVGDQPDLVMQKYVGHSRDFISNGIIPKIKKGAECTHLNEKSIQDLKVIREKMVNEKIHIEDLQFLVSKDGSIVITDPL